MTSDQTLPTCALHHDRETRLQCPRCGRPACADCLATGHDTGCAACSTEQRVTPVGATSPEPRRRGAPVTWTLLGLVVAVFVIGELTGGFRSAVFQEGAQSNALVEQGEWWRVLTATLLHGGLTHLLFNGYALYVLGPQLERGVGSLAFAALYLASGLAGGLAFLLSGAEQVAVGASGAIFGLFGAWFGASWVNRDTPQGRAGVSQLGVLLLINLALPLFIPNIAWQAHVGGLVVGALSGVIWAARSRRGAWRSSAARAAVPATFAAVLLASLLWYV